MRFKTVCRITVVVLLACFVVCVSGLGVLRWRIQSGLDDWCAVAQATYAHPGDDVAALLDYVQSDRHTLRNRNYAVWALGQARDARALPVLERLYTGTPCDHEHYLCQRELAKAIKLCKGQTPNLLCIRTP